MGSISSSVVRVRDAAGSVAGAGFLVDQRHIVTCAHVVRSALGVARDEEISGDHHVTVEFPFIRSGPVSVQAAVERLPRAGAEPRDIAGLSLDGEPPEGADPVRLVTAHPLWGHPFRVVGFPTGYQERGQWASGYLRELVGGDWLQIEADRNVGARVRQGFSGSPVWDEHLMGTAGMVVAADRDDRDRVAYMIPASSLVRGWSEVLAAQSIPPCPYRGLRPFSEDTAEDFYGRDADAATVLDATLRGALTVISGPSGCGKSSLLAAGVVPAVRDAGSWLVVQMRPGSDPFSSLAYAISGALQASQAAARWVKTPADVLAMLPKQSFRDFAAELLRQAQRERLLLVVDQLEELWTLVRDTAKRDEFVQLLTGIGRDRGGIRQVAGLVAIRADYAARARAESPSLDRLLTSNAVLVPPMGPAELREAIVRPAERAGVSFEEGLPERIIKDFQNQPNALPMLQVLLMLLWETQRERTLAIDAYLQLGGVEDALTGYADGVYDSLTHEDQTRARRVLLQLVGLAEGSPQARRPLLEKDVRAGDWAVVQRLADQRLLSMDSGEGGETFAELVHESLSWSWGRLHEWITEAEEKLRRSDEEASRIAMRFSLGAGAANLLPPPLDTMAVASTLALMGRRMAKAYGVKISREVLRTAGISMAQGVLAPAGASWGGTELLKAVPGMSVWVGLLIQPPIVAAITYAAAETWKYYFHVVSAGGRGPDNAGLREFMRLTLSNRIRQVRAKLNTGET